MLAFALMASLALSASPGPAKKTQLKLDILPSDVIVFVDGKRKGKAGKVKTVPVKPGVHLIKLVNGKDQHQEPVTVKQGETVTWKFEFEDDRPASAKDSVPTDAAAPSGAKGSGKGAGEGADGDAPAQSENPGFDGLSDPDMN